MKRSNKLIVLTAVLAVLCVATFALTRYEKKQEEIKNSDAVILEVSKDSIESVSWELSGNGLSFHKAEDGWLYDGDENFPVNEEKITSILAHFEAFGASFVIENVEDYSQYGLENPEGIITLTLADKIYELKLGDFSKMDEQRYVDIGDGNVYLVSEDPAGYMVSDLSSLILHDETPDFETVMEITYTGKESYTIVYEEESANSYSQEDVYFTERNGETAPLDPDSVTTYLDTIESLSLLNFATYYATEEELAAFGLDEPELSVTVNYSTTDKEENEKTSSYTLHLGQNQEELKEAEEAKEKEAEEIPEVTKYVRIGDSQIVYELDDASYDILAAVSYNDMRHAEVFWADSDRMTQIDISLEGEEHVLVSELKEKEGEETRIWYYNGEEIEIGDILTDLKAMTADRFTEEKADQKEEISLTIYLEHETFPQVKIQLYRYDGSVCLAAVNGETVSFVERSSVMELVEAVQAILLN